ncbi:lipoprotein-anchoring transpeptidase ErfK/SrfK [Terrimicrobium sacchariphilum]|uniref:Lipoprotein-anchoring transpeptidase ErfK/SrfK n=1 Tax=Terrimicrobium sacchariphilum TaxID=690879 RepID=A0A146GAI0_TERSA|nr:L,D-transpeptidase family protein [Terrimicrobium sacchariphilum]GAT33797.1 lipoprotein-anchoring transpeptidase ErfK/SrfK [Terrimicrobium sacchariphilum]
MTVALPHIRVKETAAILIAAAVLVVSQAAAQQGGAAAPTPRPKQKKASELIYKQEPPRIFERVLEKSTPANSTIVISLGKQRAYFLVDGETAIDSPISSGKRAGMTPKGTYKISEKDADHRSSVYGDFVSQRTGKTVRAGVSTKIDSAPSGTVYRGAPMRWFMRLTNDGVGMHTGILPGYPASHGCIRLPEEIAKLFYSKVVLGTQVTVTD